MNSLGSYVFLLVMLVQFQVIVSKPFLTDLFCDLFCDDDDNSSTSTTTSASTEDDYFGFGDWCSCGPTTRRPPNSRRGQGTVPSAINMRLPPSNNGMDLSFGLNNGQWSFNLNAFPNNTGGFVPPGNMPTTNAPTTAAAAGTTAATTAAAATTAKK